jgi:hypothetical protein
VARLKRRQRDSQMSNRRIEVTASHAVDIIMDNEEDFSSGMNIYDIIRQHFEYDSTDDVVIVDDERVYH